MALELIKSDRTIQALKPGVKRLTDGGGLYLLPFAKGRAGSSTSGLWEPLDR